MATYGARQRRTGTPTAGVDSRAKKPYTARLSQSTKDKAEAVAAALDISFSALVGELIERLEVDENHHPGWESKYAPADDEQLELSA